MSTGWKNGQKEHKNGWKNGQTSTSPASNDGVSVLSPNVYNAIDLLMVFTQHSNQIVWVSDKVFDGVSDAGVHGASRRYHGQVYRAGGSYRQGERWGER